MAEAGWAQSINRQEELARLRNSSYSSAGSLSKESAPISTPSTSGKRSTPFMLAVDLPRSLIFMLQAFIGYLLMLAVMSYSAWYFIAILLGLGAGELALGRYAHSHEGTGLHM